MIVDLAALQDWGLYERLFETLKDWHVELELSGFNDPRMTACIGELTVSDYEDEPAVVVYPVFAGAANYDAPRVVMFIDIKKARVL